MDSLWSIPKLELNQVSNNSVTRQRPTDTQNACRGVLWLNWDKGHYLLLHCIVVAAQNCCSTPRNSALVQTRPVSEEATERWAIF